MSDAQDQIARLAAEAQQRADVAGTQAAWQEGRAHGLRAAVQAAPTPPEADALEGDVEAAPGAFRRLRVEGFEGVEHGATWRGGRDGCGCHD